jgi:hypothetical protein
MRIIWGIVCFPALLAVAEDYPSAEISSSDLQVKLYLPDSKQGFYRATRFDWSGLISSLVYRGHEYYGQWFRRVDPKVRDFAYEGSDIVASPCTAALGPAEEFVSDGNQPLGYRDAKAGGTFVKIGVGALRKPDDSNYNRFALYELVDPGKWAVKKTANSIEFTQSLDDPRSGYGYVYRKTISLSKNEMTIAHSLKNTGTKPIETSVYNHNFLRIDGAAPGPDYTITVPFAIQSNRPPNADLAEIRGNQILYKKILDNQDRVATPIQGFGSDAKDFDVRIENRNSGAGLRMTGDQPLQSESLWSIRAVLAVEPFVNVHAAPGEEFSWILKYAYLVQQTSSGLPDGPGKQQLLKTCTSCHDEGPVIGVRRTKADWERIIDDMVGRGANGTDEDLDSIAAYLEKNFGK